MNVYTNKLKNKQTNKYIRYQCNIENLYICCRSLDRLILFLFVVLVQSKTYFKHSKDFNLTVQLNVDAAK